ncbi:hypothetical protein [Blastococcus saxobsidens]|uniref:Uncharacterized protein n=1 Tax=Blastococcus saxobsidens TaxID=138336 RepID=A0A4Q7Y7K8_9ACTN|nr:hypothetical protein [Blastococcus saxobsidens]RZU31969.1 hypothetical protein BKA19_1655 [Blastococcus saxobsidens]
MLRANLRTGGEIRRSVAVREVFGDLAGEPCSAEPYRATRASVRQSGVRLTPEALA